MIAFLHASALIYLVDAEPLRVWAKSAQATLQQPSLDAPDLTLAVSRINVLQCRVAPIRRGDLICLDCFEAFFAQPDLQMVELSAVAVELAMQLRANHGLHTTVALQA